MEIWETLTTNDHSSTYTITYNNNNYNTNNMNLKNFFDPKFRAGFESKFCLIILQLNY